MKTMKFTSGFGIALSVLAAISQAKRLDKPALTPDLGYLLQGSVDNLHPTHSTWDKWGDGWIPEDCKSMAQNPNLNLNLNPSDFEVYNVHYDDCGDAWVLCRHKDSPVDLVTTVDIFGRLPVRMRDWVRHVMTVPGNDYAFNLNGNIVFSGRTSTNMDVAIHETGHSLDLLKAYGEVLSSSQTWIDNYNQDSNVPDNYAQSSQIENVAQNTVVSVFDKIVPGGFGSVQPNWHNIFHQYATLKSKAGDLILPGGQCDRRLKDSSPIPMDSNANEQGLLSWKPRTSFVNTYNNIVTNFEPFNTAEHCKESFS
ncbi:uncharacterized protein ATNIH1004_005264 [Aspergillus tanneri]|uniref:Conidiation-specific protein 13 n=1 Tax=Aspergillus tanneri TaxID=1220188 RepID=A0A5M9MWU4_9EURO|nr:uncharacterized protein ATNIH1004_005264 [Aspergillus tanneri]KAA8649363.1 hypothetical protein ATNIH1004_005264 [Aspergillus tanneri]